MYQLQCSRETNRAWIVVWVVRMVNGGDLDYSCAAWILQPGLGGMGLQVTVLPTYLPLGAGHNRVWGTRIHTGMKTKCDSKNRNIWFVVRTGSDAFVLVGWLVGWLDRVMDHDRYPRRQ